MSLDMPQTLGGYRVIERLGGGADAELFKARRGDGTWVCIKRLHPNLSDDPMFERRFERELKLAQELRHRNIVEVSGHGHEDGYYFVMEYIDGPSLDVLLGAGVLSPSLVIYIGVELCRAFGFLHRTDPETGRKPAIHSDVSPHNILLGRDGGVKLSDFGLAKAISRTGAETITQARGKLTYFSPEQWLEQPIGTSTDLFSLGLVMWQMLVGTHPYGEGRPLTRPRTSIEEWVRRRTVDNARRSASEAAPHAPAALCAAIDGLLQPVQTRIPTAEDVFRSLCSVEPLDGHAQLAAWLERVEGGGR